MTTVTFEEPVDECSRLGAFCPDIIVHRRPSRSLHGSAADLRLARHGPTVGRCPARPEAAVRVPAVSKVYGGSAPADTPVTPLTALYPK